jgi:hypothetical protein
MPDTPTTEKRLRSLEAAYVLVKAERDDLRVRLAAARAPLDVERLRKALERAIEAMDMVRDGLAVRSTDAIVIGEESILRHAAREARAALEEPTPVNRSKPCSADLLCYRYQGHGGEHAYPTTDAEAEAKAREYAALEEPTP